MARTSSSSKSSKSSKSSNPGTKVVFLCGKDGRVAIGQYHKKESDFYLADIESSGFPCDEGDKNSTMPNITAAVAMIIEEHLETMPKARLVIAVPNIVYNSTKLDTLTQALWRGRAVVDSSHRQLDKVELNIYKRIMRGYSQLLGNIVIMSSDYIPKTHKENVGMLIETLITLKEETFKLITKKAPKFREGYEDVDVDGYEYDFEDYLTD